jgi:hypothetical protein
MALCGTAAGAALPEDYLTSIPVTDTVPLQSSECAESGSEADIPFIFDFPLIRIIDADGDNNPDLLLFGDNVRIVLTRIDFSCATHPCGSADPGGELRDCGEGNGAASPGACETSLSVTISSIARSALLVDRLI